MKKTLLIGANSGIAEAVARRLAARGEDLYLLGRSPERLQALAADLGVRGGQVAGFAVFDARRLDTHAEILEAAVRALGGLDAVLIAHGTLGDQKACEASVSETMDQLSTNALSVISLCTLLANRFEAQGSGCLAVISSVAGDRGRQSNYVYGTAKAAVSAFTQGLRNRLHRSGVHVLTIKPGFVDTPMTAGLKKGPLFASADQVAGGIVAAMDKAKDVVYLPFFWAPIMALIRAVPERIFKKLRL
ncbi:MAG TPA: SDR family oxidoreductase [bacterium]|nr:SDR family oxidoreductase [bacterium]